MPACHASRQAGNLLNIRARIAILDYSLVLTDQAVRFDSSVMTVLFPEAMTLVLQLQFFHRIPEDFFEVLNLVVDDHYTFVFQ